VVHRGISTVQQLLGVTPGVACGDANAGGHPNDPLRESAWSAEAVHDPPGDVHSGLAGRALAHHDELVSGLARERVLRAGEGIQSSSHLDQQPVADFVPERVVDLLEPVEVDEQNGEGVVGAELSGQRLLQTVQQQDAVRQPCERVVQRSVAQLLLQLQSPGCVGEQVVDGADELLVPVVGVAGALDHQEVIARVLGVTAVAPVGEGDGAPVGEGRAYDRGGVVGEDGEISLGQALLADAGESGGFGGTPLQSRADHLLLR